MNLRAIFLCAGLACAALGCASVDEPPPPVGPAALDGGSSVNQDAAITGGELFNGNY